MSIPQVSPMLAMEAEMLSTELVSLTPWQELGYRPETLRHYLLGTQNGFYCLGVHVKGELAGVITLRSPWLRGTLLEFLAVLPSFQHQGLGKWLMQWLIANVKSKNQHNLWTLVSAFNTSAIQFYHSQGFSRVGQLDDFIVEGQHELLLRCIIKPIKSVD